MVKKVAVRKKTNLPNYTIEEYRIETSYGVKRWGLYESKDFYSAKEIEATTYGKDGKCFTVKNIFLNEI